MGCWSYPIVAVCYDKNGKVIHASDVIIDFTNVYYNSPMKLLSDHGTIVEGIVLFKESIMATRDGAKIAFCEKPELDAWSAYFNLLLGQNKNVETAEAHFYHTDGNFPYFISKSQDRKLCVMVGSEDSVIYTKVNFDCHEDYEYPFGFDKEMYIDILFNHRNVFCYAFSGEPRAVQIIYDLK